MSTFLTQIITRILATTRLLFSTFIHFSKKKVATEEEVSSKVLTKVTQDKWIMTTFLTQIITRILATTRLLFCTFIHFSQKKATKQTGKTASSTGNKLQFQLIMAAIRQRYTQTLAFQFLTLRDCNASYLANSWEQYYINWIIRYHRTIRGSSPKPSVILYSATGRESACSHKWTAQNLWPPQERNISSSSDSIPFCMVQYDLNTRHISFVDGKSPWKDLIEIIRANVCSVMYDIEDNIRQHWNRMHTIPNWKVVLQNHMIESFDIIRTASASSDEDNMVLFDVSLRDIKFANKTGKDLIPFSEILVQFYQQSLEVLEEMVSYCSYKPPFSYHICTTYA